MKRHGRSDLNRRTVLHGFGGLASFSLAGSLAGTAFAQDAKEAADLARMVADGKLPPLAQRLPEMPMVVTPVEKVGQYGGQLRRGLRGSADHNGILRMIGNQGLTRWNLAFTDVLPSVAHKWDASADGKEFVFYLRKGMRWSDGKPFTADDIVFSMEDCVKNQELYKFVPTVYVINGQGPTVTRVDEHTVKFTFAGSYGLFLQQLATPLGQHPTLFPKHYCSQFHPKYNPNVADLVRQANVSDWGALFRLRCGDIEIPSRWGNVDKPTIDPWIMEEPYTGGATRVIAKRNPYFWQVDTAGNQLPYIDRIVFGISQDVESLMLEAVSGRLDIQERHIDSLQNKPTLAEAASRGNFRLFEQVNSGSNSMIIYPNITHKDPAMRAMLANKEFREALSVAIDRKEIIEIVYLGQSEPWQTGPRPGHPWYNEKLSRQYTAHEPARANSILDRLGYNRRDSNRFRLRPDGQRVFMSIDVIPTLYPDHTDVLELVKRHWAAIGVDVKINTIERALYYTRGDNNDHDMAVWPGPGGLDPVLDARDYLAMHPQGSRYAIPWTIWYSTGGKDGQEPPESQKQRMKLYDQARATPDVMVRGQLMSQVFDLAAEAFETIGIALAPNLVGVAANRLRNVPERMPNSWSWPNPGPSLPQQYYFTG